LSRALDAILRPRSLGAISSRWRESKLIVGGSRLVEDAGWAFP
jgi:hypothetical protein